MATSIDEFCVDGFIVVRGAVAPDTVSACVEVIDNELEGSQHERPLAVGALSLGPVNPT